MKKSLFIKYLASFSAIIVISFLVLGITVVTFVSRYSKAEKQDLLINNASKIADLMVEYNISEVNDPIQIRAYEWYFQQIADNISSDIFIIQKDGTMIAGSVDQSNAVPTFSEDILLSIQTGQSYNKIGNLNGFYSSPQYIVGKPIIYNDEILGAAFICAPASSLTALIYAVTQIFAFSASFIMIIAVGVSYFVTRKMTRPINGMSRAAKSYANGDFSARVPVTSDDELGMLAMSFNNMAIDLGNLENMRQSFIANVSHDLKTPMTSIVGFIDGILDGTIKKEDQAYYLKLVSEEIMRLSRLVTSLMDIAKIEAGKMELKKITFDVAEDIRQILIGFEKRFSVKNIEVETDFETDRVRVFADHDSIYQVLYNLIDNAVKFTNIDGTLRISIFLRDSKANIIVYNSGQGIDREEIPFVFDRFYKSDKSRGLDRNGTGLGLYIVKTIIDLHGEEIYVRSVKNEFCEFRVTLSLDPK
ncbi:MAG: HAMP domain-containing sensor histidine kinase [Candidatus Pacebacteria bacterium]|nr:HAMP domain-containing sensor histidine kinase [Candidatus Paceibacterota bacterium]